MTCENNLTYQKYQSLWMERARTQQRVPQQSSYERHLSTQERELVASVAKYMQTNSSYHTLFMVTNNIMIYQVVLCNPSDVVRQKNQDLDFTVSIL